MDQQVENQLAELQRFASLRGWRVEPYIDRGISGTRQQRPALDLLMAAARRRKIDVVLCWRLDRLGRNLRHLILLLDELQALGVSFVSLHEGIDTTTPAGRLQMHVLGAIAEFERDRLGERVRAGLARTRANGTRLGRLPVTVPTERVLEVAGLSARKAADAMGVSISTLKRWRRVVQKTSATTTSLSPTFAPEPTC